MSKYPITKNGVYKINKEIEALRKKRVLILNAISEAKKKGDLSENAEYHAAKEELSFLDKKVSKLGSIVSQCYVVENIDDTKVAFGVKVRLLNVNTNQEKSYTIVGEYESDITKNLISINAPLVREILDKSVDEVVLFETPRGTIEYRILSIEIPNDINV